MAERKPGMKMSQSLLLGEECKMERSRTFHQEGKSSSGRAGQRVNKGESQQPRTLSEKEELFVSEDEIILPLYNKEDRKYEGNKVKR